MGPNKNYLPRLRETSSCIPKKTMGTVLYRAICGMVEHFCAQNSFRTLPLIEALLLNISYAIFMHSEVV